MNTKLLWTSGWDSTFRLVQLSRMEGDVTPVYVKGDNRHSESIEIEHMNTLLDLLKKHPETKANLLPLEIIDKKDIPLDEEITESYYNLRKIAAVGTQYEWLARYAKLNPGIELGAIMPDGEYSGIRYIINTYGSYDKTETGSYVLSKSCTYKDCINVFGNFSFPLAFTTENEMKKIVEELGYEDIMSHIWFCHHPIKGETCGLCRPCEQKIEGHMEYLVTADAMKRYRFQKKLCKAFGKKIGKKIAHVIYRGL